MTLEPSSLEPQRRSVCGWSVRWDEDRARDACASGWWQRHTMAQEAARLAADEPGRVLLTDSEGVLDARTLHAGALHLAHYFQASGLSAGDCIGIMLPNWREAAQIYLAATLGGLVVCPLIMAYGANDLRFILEDSGCRLLFVAGNWRGRDCAGLARTACADLTRPPALVVVRGADMGEPEAEARFEHIMTHPWPTVPLPVVDPDSVKMVIYTSGTTGRPKAVLHSHNSLFATARQIHEYWQAGPDSCFLVSSPIGHIGGSIYCFEVPLLYRARAVLQDVWDADQAIDLIKRHGCTHMAGATPFLDQLLKAARARNQRLPSLRLFICGGASVPPHLIEDARAFFAHCHPTRVYGSSEVPLTTVGWLDRAAPGAAAQTDGRVGITTVRVEDSEILARGPQMFLGYGNPADEAAAFTADGFFRTGDLGTATPDGVITITGRRKDLIIRNGENISPREIEDVLMAGAGVSEICVIGLPDARTGERVVAVAVATAGTTARPELADLNALLAQAGLARFKQPEQLVWLPSLPRNVAGKVLKHEVRQLVLAR